LLSACHKQGFASLDEVDRAVLEPGGTMSFFAKKPTIDDERHAALLAQLEQLRREIGCAFGRRRQDTNEARLKPPSKGLSCRGEASL